MSEGDWSSYKNATDEEKLAVTRVELNRRLSTIKTAVWLIQKYIELGCPEDRNVDINYWLDRITVSVQDLEMLKREILGGR
jgi:hypothetical protein